MAVLFEKIQKDIRLRDKSDRQMSSVWILIYIFPFIVGIIGVGYTVVYFLDFLPSFDPLNPYNFSYDEFVAGFAIPFFIFGVSGLINFIVSIGLTYLFVNRRSTHFKGQKFLSKDIIAVTNSLAKTMNVEVEASVFSIERTVRAANAEEIEKSAILWSVLSAFVPFVQLYVYFFLMNDFYRHERREDRFWKDLGTTMNKLGINFSVPRRTQAMPDRSFVLYLILTIITAGLFGVYWVYALVKDPNEHFKTHIETESQLLTALESVTV